MSLLKLLKQTIGAQQLDEELYAAALDEFNSGARRKGLWAKALIDGQGDTGKSESIYLKLLVEAISRDARAHPMPETPPELSPKELRDLQFKSPQWYYIQSGSQHGPVYLHELNSIIRSGSLGPDARVFGPGVATWRSVQDFARQI